MSHIKKKKKKERGSRKIDFWLQEGVRGDVGTQKVKCFT